VPFVTGLATASLAARYVFGRAARSAGESLDGGLLEFLEFSPNRRRSSAFSASSTAIRASVMR
jgi:hypothetical protein